MSRQATKAQLGGSYTGGGCIRSCSMVTVGVVMVAIVVMVMGVFVVVVDVVVLKIVDEQCRNPPVYA